MKNKYKIYRFVEVGSTMDVARQIAENTNEEVVVIAQYQTKGRGKLNRSWHSPEDGLWFSIAIKINRLPIEAKMGQLSLLVCLAVAKSIIKINKNKLNIQLKWPNDVLVNNKKVSGILLEATNKNIIIGIGINVNCDIELFPPQLKDKSTSLKNELNKQIDKEELFNKIMEEFDKLYELFVKEGFGVVLHEYEKLDCILNKHIIIIREDNRVEEAKALKINQDGSLKVKLLPYNKIEDIYAGDISVKTT